MSKRNKPKNKRINPAFWVFCEGKTEKAYVSFLRSKYRLPIEIISKVSGSDINDSFIRNSKLGKPTHSKDKDFLLYDGDVPETIKQLENVDNATMLLSNPSIELWYLYHYKNQKAHISSDECIKELTKRDGVTYKKGYIHEKLRQKLDGYCEKACARAKASKLFDNPSSNVYILIEELAKHRSVN